MFSVDQCQDPCRSCFCQLVHWSVCLFVFLSALCLSVYPFFHLSIYPSIGLSFFCLSSYLSAHLPLSPSICLPICPYLYLFVCPLILCGLLSSTGPGRNHGQVFNTRCGCMHAKHLCCYEIKLPNLKLKTQAKQLLGCVLLDISLPNRVHDQSIENQQCVKLCTDSHKG